LGPKVKGVVLGGVGPGLGVVGGGKGGGLGGVGGGGVLNSLERRLMRQILAGGNPREWWD